MLVQKGFEREPVNLLSAFDPNPLPKPIRVAAMLAGLGLSQSRVRWPKSSLPEGA